MSSSSCQVKERSTHNDPLLIAKQHRRRQTTHFTHIIIEETPEFASSFLIASNTDFK